MIIEKNPDDNSRWLNKLNPKLSKKKWDQGNGRQLFELHQALGPKWKVIVESFPGRTDNFLKNQFFSLIRRSLRRIVKFLKTPKSLIFYLFFVFLLFEFLHFI